MPQSTDGGSDRGREGAEVTFTAPHVVEYAYRRSVGPVLSRFFTALRARALVGSRTRAGRVLVPPCEYDPETGEAVSEIVDVGPAGVVTSWAWVQKPSAKHPLAKPFAWALIRLDGADTALLHAVDAGAEPRMRTGLRVRPRWRAQTNGEIRDIECFEPEGKA
jgi:uncharacterized OB-fold protein